MDEASRARLNALAHRRRVAAPDISVAIEGWPEEALRAAQLVWSRRVFNETGSVDIACRLSAAAVAAGISEPAVTSACRRLEEDERAHASLATAVLARLGGAMPASPDRPGPSVEPAAVDFARLVLTGLAVCETVSAARYEAVRRHTDLPMFRACIELFLRDEVAHSELGFLLVPTALETLTDAVGDQAGRDLVARELRATFQRLDWVVGLDAERRGTPLTLRPQPTGNPGVVEPLVDAAAFYEAVRDVILPRLEQLGIDARAAWAERWAERWAASTS